MAKPAKPTKAEEEKKKKAYYSKKEKKAKEVKNVAFPPSHLEACCQAAPKLFRLCLVGGNGILVPTCLG